MGNPGLYRSADSVSALRWSAISRAAELRRKAQAGRGKDGKVTGRDANLYLSPCHLINRAENEVPFVIFWESALVQAAKWPAAAWG
jgi:hypothetical protein